MEILPDNILEADNDAYKLFRLQPQNRLIYLRWLLDKLAFNNQDLKNPDLIDGISGIRIVERYNQGSEREDSINYYFPNQDSKQTIHYIFNKYEQLLVFVISADIIYLNNRLPVHLGFSYGARCRLKMGH